MMDPVILLKANKIDDNIISSLPYIDGEDISTLSSSDENKVKQETLSNKNKIIFDKVLNEMLTRHFYLIRHEFASCDQFEGWVYTCNRHRYKIVIGYRSLCSCKKFKRYHVCKHFLFVLKRFFNVDLNSMDLRRCIMEYQRFDKHDLECIFEGQIRRVCSIVPPLVSSDKKENSSLSFKRQSIYFDDVCPICFERLLAKDKKLVTCFQSCGKSMHESCMNKWIHVQGKSAHCPLCQALWKKPSATEKAVLDFYERRSYSIEKHERYCLCCLYAPSDSF